MSQLQWMKPAFGSDLRDPSSISAIEAFLASLPSASSQSDIRVSADKQQANGVPSLPLQTSSPDTATPPGSVDNGSSSPGRTSTSVDNHVLTSHGKRKSLEGTSILSQNSPKHSKSTVNSQSSDDKETDLHETKSKTSDRRKEQNRNAQRAFRDRKEKRLRELEDQVAALKATHQTSQNENANLRNLVSQLQSENRRLSVYQQAFTFTMNTIGQGSLPQSRGAAYPDENLLGNDAPSNSPPVKRESMDLPGVAPVAFQDNPAKGLYSIKLPDKFASAMSDSKDASANGSSNSPKSPASILTPPPITSGISPSALLATSPASMSFGGSNSSASVSPTAYRVPTPPAVSSKTTNTNVDVFNGLHFWNESDWAPLNSNVTSNLDDYGGPDKLNLPGLTPILDFPDFLGGGAARNSSGDDVGKALEVDTVWSWPKVGTTYLPPETTSLVNGITTNGQRLPSIANVNSNMNIPANFLSWRDQTDEQLESGSGSGALLVGPDSDDFVVPKLLDSGSCATTASMTTTTTTTSLHATPQACSNVANACDKTPKELRVEKSSLCMKPFVESGVLSQDELDDLCFSLNTKATCSEKAQVLREVGQKHPKLEGVIHKFESAAKAAAAMGRDGGHQEEGRSRLINGGIKCSLKMT